MSSQQNENLADERKVEIPRKPPFPPRKKSKTNKSVEGWESKDDPDCNADDW